MRVLVYVRDKEYILLDAATIRQYFPVENVEAIALDKVLPRRGQEAVSLEDAPESVIEPMLNYPNSTLSSLYVVYGNGYYFSPQHKKWVVLGKKYYSINTPNVSPLPPPLYIGNLVFETWENTKPLFRREKKDNI